MITIEKTIKGYKKVRDNTKFKSWLYTIGKRETFKYLQKYGKKVCIDLDEQDIEDELYNIEQIILNKEECEKVAVIIKEFDDNYKQLIVFRYYYDYTLIEIAQIMGENLNTIKTWYRRALMIIENKFEEEFKV